MAGLVQVRKTDPSVSELMEQHRILGNFQDALACCESLGRLCTYLPAAAVAAAADKASKTSKLDPKLPSNILKCYLEMDQPHTAATLAKGKQLPQIKLVHGHFSVLLFELPLLRSAV